MLDLVGTTFGHLTVLARDDSRAKGNGVHSFWVCRCQCGTIKSIRQTGLRSGRTKSCGCRRMVVHTTHGMSDSREFATWAAMIRRCYSPTHKQFADYGGRGIDVCDEWRASFEAFFRDMGPRPSPRHSLDRRDNDAGYSKDNCRWATTVEQQRNRRSNKTVTFAGKTMTMIEWAEALNLPRGTLEKRFSNGWSVERALTTPRRSYPFQR